MRNNTMGILAVFSVLLMLGCAFAPVFAGDSDGISVDDGVSREYDSSSLDILTIMNELNGMFFGSSPDNKSMLVPISTSGMPEIGDPLCYHQGKEDQNTFNGDLVVTPNPETGAESQMKVCYLGGGYTYKFNPGGWIDVKAGGMLVLRNLSEKSDDGFSLVNNRDTTEGSSNLILLENGALVYYMGILFKVVTNESEGLALFRCSVGAKVTFANTYEDGKRTLSIMIDKADSAAGLENDLSFIMLNLLEIDYKKDTESKENPDVSISGTISNDGGRLTVTDADFYALTYYNYMERADEIYTVVDGHIDSLTYGYGIWDQTGDPEFDSTLDVTGSIESAALYVHSLTAVYPLLYVDNYVMALNCIDEPMSFRLVDAKVHHAGTVSNEALTGADYTSSIGKISLSGDAELNVVVTSSTEPQSLENVDVDTNMTFTIHGFEAAVSNITEKYSASYGGTFSYTDESNLGFGMSMATVAAYDSVSETSSEMSGLKISLVNDRRTSDGTEIDGSADSLAITGRYGCESGLKYPLDFAVTLTDLVSVDRYVKEKENYYRLDCDVSATVSTTLDGEIRTLKATLANASYIYDPANIGDDGVRALADEIVLTNDIPLNRIIKGTSIGQFQLSNQSFIGSFRMTKADYTAEYGFKGKSLDFDIQTLDSGKSDRIGYSIDNDFVLGMTYLKDGGDLTGIKVTFHSTSDLNGFTKTIGDEKIPFVIRTNSVGELDASFTVWLLGTVSIEVDEGTADFSNGGLIPAIVVIGENAKFSGKDVSAIGFHFANDAADRKGTVSFDFSDGMSSVSRSISFGVNDADETITVYRYYDGIDYGGYKITFDAGDFTTGTIKTNKGCSLDGKWSQQGFSKIDVIDGSSAKFTIDSTDVDLYLRCVHETYDLYVDGELLGSYRYADTVTIEGKYRAGSNRVLIGWNDGCKSLIGVVEGGKVTCDYAMPARNVYLTSTIAEKAVVDKTNNVVRSDSTAILIPTSAINQGKELTVIVDNMTMKLSADTVKKIFDGKSEVIIDCCRLQGSDSEVKSKVIGDNPVFDIKVIADGELYTDYGEDTSFEVTLRIDFDKRISGIKSVSFIDDDGHTFEVGISDSKVVSDKTGEVTFTVNHFSQYMIEPEYYEGTDSDNGLLIVMTVFVVLVIAVVGAVLCRQKMYY